MQSVIDVKDYLESEFHLTVSDFKCARSEDEQFAVRQRMSRTLRTAAETVSFDFAEHLLTFLSELEEVRL